MAHLSDDETVAKMGHPNLDLGHPSRRDVVLFHGCGSKAPYGLVGAIGREADFSTAQLALRAASVEMTIWW